MALAQHTIVPCPVDSYTAHVLRETAAYWHDHCQVPADATPRVIAHVQARLARGLVLALHGHVRLFASGNAEVLSSDLETVYAQGVSGCECPDAARAHHGMCKHRWAVHLFLTGMLPEMLDVAPPCEETTLF